MKDKSSEIKGFWRDLRALLRRHRGKLLITLGIGVGLLFLLVAIVAQKSEKPEFCLNCHIMEPYYESWKTSSHKNVNCLLCHFKPGWQGFIRGKVVAFSQFVRYITVTYGSKPWAEIPDESCLRSGCHEGTRLKGPMEYKKGISFDHSHHLGDLRRGKQLRCTSCHSQIVQGSHMMVTPAVCFICHFKPEPDGSRNAKMTNCRTCHAKGVSGPQTPDEHALFMDRGTDCMKCHFGVIRGEGLVPPRRCESCHADPLHLQVQDPQALHEEHVTNHKVECFECHDPIEHRVETVEEIVNADCGICHAERHQLQKSFYKGTTAVPFGTTVTAAMVKAHIACSGCHFQMEDGDRPTSPTALKGVAHASGKACDYCHGPGYDRLLGDWHSEIGRRLSQIRGLTRVAQDSLPSTGTAIAQAAKDIYYTLDVIQEVRAVHNIGYSATLIDHTQSALLNATSQTAVGRPVKEWLREEIESFAGAPSCLQHCHYGITQRSTYLKNQNRTFRHAPHLSLARLDCGTCHSREIHKVNLPRGYDCIGCHHEQAGQKKCADCHQDMVELAKGGLGGHDMPSPQNLDCDSCHKGPGNQIVMLNRSACSQCHADTKEYLGLLEKHREELGRLSVAANEALETRWPTLDLRGLQMGNLVRTVDRLNGVHNYPLAKRIYQEARTYLAQKPASGAAAALPVPISPLQEESR